jgi:hypothetical protein
MGLSLGMKSMNLEITDSTGQILTITTDLHGLKFAATACSPHADGFTMLNATVGGRMSRAELKLACQQSIERGEVCILPTNASPTTRVMIVPNAGGLDPVGRQRASALMSDLFRATQSSQVAATSLLISHFCCMNRYPQIHVLGICDAINELKRQSFTGLKTLGFEVAPSILTHFEQDVGTALSI